MSAEVFTLETQADEAGFCLTGLRTEWKKLSDEKGWPITAEGWRRYLERAVNTGRGPMKPKEKIIVASVIPPAFVAWWKLHAHSGFIVSQDGQEHWNFTPRLSFNCLRYRREYETAVAVRRMAA